MLSIVKACGDLALLRHLKARLVIISAMDIPVAVFRGISFGKVTSEYRWLIQYAVPCCLRGLQAALQGEVEAARHLSSHTATAQGLQAVVAGRGSARNETETT